jgi:hypothetical protein|tara:strand:+ start:1369 stop:1686 length:318 start_codon:yes stop_codon:yes gene_type:complete
MDTDSSHYSVMSTEELEKLIISMQKNLKAAEDSHKEKSYSKLYTLVEAHNETSKAICKELSILDYTDSMTTVRNVAAVLGNAMTPSPVQLVSAFKYLQDAISKKA